ncbi:hypothetical protein ACQEVZ_39680 [Dactylosporangium sp. CA-152071]|uniref:hypothetical protein n=1 Tax=Dactylosporangium sp. CA-152071 TaxID=3239933 RepID=UPI003D8A7DB7
MPTPSGALLLPVSVSEGEVVRAQRYALSAAQTDEVRIIVAEEAQLRGPLLFRFLRGVPPSIFAVSYVDAVLVDPSPVAGVVVSAADMLARPVEVGLGSVDGFVGGVFEFRDGFGSVPRVFADRVRVWPVDAVDEGVNTAEAVAGRIGARFGVVPGSEAGTYGLGHGWVVQVFEWGLWVRPDGVTDGVVAGVVAGVEQRVAGEVGRGGAAPRPLVLLGESGGGTVPDVVLDRLEEARRVLPRRVVARLRVEWLGARPPSRVTELAEVPRFTPLLGRLAEAPDLGRGRVRGMLADLGVALGGVTVGNVDELRPQWIGLLLGGDARRDDVSFLAELLDLIDERVDAAGFDWAGIEAVSQATGVSTALVSALSLRIGRVPVELRGTDPDGRVIRLAAWLGVDPAVLPADSGLLADSGLFGLFGLLDEAASASGVVVGPGDAARRAAAVLRGDPVWSAAHPPEGALRTQLMRVAVRAAELGVVTADEVAPFEEWFSAQWPDDSLDDMASIALEELRLQWLAAMDLVPADDPDGRVTRLAARRGVDPAVLLAHGLLEEPASAPGSVVGPADAAPPREDPALRTQLMQEVARAAELGVGADEEAPFEEWFAAQWPDDSLDDMASIALEGLRLQWLAAAFLVPAGDIGADAVDRPWLVHGAALRVARRLRIEPHVVRRAAIAVEDLPADFDDLAEIAERHGTTTAVLWNLMIDLELDPWALEPVLAGRTRFDAAGVRADLDEWTALLGVSDRIALAFLRDTRRTSTDLGRTTSDDLDAWAAMILGTDDGWARRYRYRLGRRYLDPVLWAADALTPTPGDLIRTAHASGVSPYWLAAASARTGYPYTDLPHIAQQLQIDPPQLLAIAADLPILPESLGGLLDDLQGGLLDKLRSLLNGPQPPGAPYRVALALAEQLRPHLPRRIPTPSDPPRLHPGHRDYHTGVHHLVANLRAVTGDDRDVVTQVVREAYEHGRVRDVGYIAQDRLQAIWVENWAPRLGQPVEVVRADLRRYVWLSPPAVEVTAAEIGGGTDPAEVWKFAVRFGRMPDDLHQLAEPSGIEPSALFQIGLTFDTDPRHLSPILSVYRPDQQRTLTEHITEWVAWFDERIDVRPDRGLLMTALHDNRMTIESVTDPGQLRDIVDSWIATTLGQSVEAFHELEQTSTIDIRAGWDLMTDQVHPHYTRWSYPSIANRFGVSAVWLRGVILRSGITRDLTGWDEPLQATAQLALAADLRYLPKLSREQTDRLRVPGMWRSTVREMAAAFPRHPERSLYAHHQHVQNTVSILALFAAFPKLPLPVDQHADRAHWFGSLRMGTMALTERPNNMGHIYGRELDLAAQSPQIWAAFAEHASASEDSRWQARMRLMDRFVDAFGKPWPVPGLAGGGTPRVVHAADAAAGKTHLAHMYLSYAIGLYIPDDWSMRWARPMPGPGSAGLSRALGLDRAAEVLDSDGWLRHEPVSWRLGSDSPPDAAAYRGYLWDAEGIFVDSLLAAYPDASGFLRFDGVQDDAVSAFDGVVQHLATTEGGARGIVLYRTSTETTTGTGVINAFRGPSGEVVFVDPLTLSLAVLPTEGQVEVVFLPTRGPGPVGVSRVDPRTDPAWPDPLREHAAALGVSRPELGQMFIDMGLTAAWSGDLKAARVVVDDWQADVLGVTGVSESEATRIQRLTAQLAQLAGWSIEAAGDAARRLGVSPAWLRATVLLAGVVPADMPTLADLPHLASRGTGILDRLVQSGGRSASVEPTDDEDGRPGSGQRPWADVLRLLPHIGDDVTDEQLKALREALRVTLAEDGVDVAALPEEVRAAYAAAVLGDASAFLTALRPRVAEGGVAHAGTGPATAAERRLYVSRLQLPRLRTGNEDALARVVDLDAGRRAGRSGGSFRRLARIGDLLGRYPGSGGFVRFLDGAGRRVPGFGGLVRRLAGTGDAGIVVHRSLDSGGRPVQRVLYAFDVQGTVVLVDPVTLQLAEVPAGAAADVLFLSTGGQATTGGRSEPVDADADWAATLTELFLPPLLLPDGVTFVESAHDGHAFIVGDSGVRSPLWRNVKRFTGRLPTRFVIVDQPSDDEVSGRLKILLERLRLRGQVPVILAPKWTAALDGVRDQYGTAIVYQTAPPGGQSSLRLGNVWALTSAQSTRPDYHGATLALQILHDAETLVMPPPPPPPMLASWLDAWARGDREASRSMLAEHSTELTSQAVLDWLAGMANRAPRGVNDAQVHDTLVRLARLDQTDLAYQFLTAPDAAARVTVTLSVEPQHLTAVTLQLANLGEAIANGPTAERPTADGPLADGSAAEGPVDRANAAVLRALHEVLTNDNPKDQWFPANIIKNLTPQDKIRWADRLRELSQMPQFSPNQQTALSHLRNLTLTC